MRVQFAEGQLVDAEIVGSDPGTDLALLDVDLDGVELKPLALGDSQKVEVADAVVAPGNPFGLSDTITAGIVSASSGGSRPPTD